MDSCFSQPPALEPPPTSDCDALWGDVQGVLAGAAKVLVHMTPPSVQQTVVCACRVHVTFFLLVCLKVFHSGGVSSPELDYTWHTWVLKTSPTHT